jgi:translation initiation factor eIF-2B subunit delta
MTTEAPKPVPAGQPSEKKDKKEQKKDQPKDQAAAPGEKKLSGAELKKRAKEEKAARRAQAKAVQAPQGPPAAGQQTGSLDGKGGKSRPKQDGGAKLPLRPATAAVPKEVKPSIPDCFSHLSIARRIDMTQADKDIDPAVLVLGEHMSSFALSDSITRLEATLLAFKKVGRLHTR